MFGHFTVISVNIKKISKTWDDLVLFPTFSLYLHWGGGGVNPAADLKTPVRNVSQQQTERKWCRLTF